MSFASTCRLPPLLLLWLLLLSWIGDAQAHAVRHHIVAADAVVVTLTYANGKPFAHKKYTLTASGQEAPAQTGNTDSQGRVIFVPGVAKDWRLVASATDGHGVNLEFAIPVLTKPVAVPTDGMVDNAPATPRCPETAAAPLEVVPRWLLAGFGIALIFGFFGLFRLFVTSRSR